MGRDFRDSEGREYDRPSRPNSRDSRGYFRDGVEQEKKPYRHAPGPITREKLESVEVRESMTQLKKRETPKTEEKLEEKPEPEKIEPPLALSGLVDADMLENISEDED